jgi:hypothetical protein
VKWGFFAKHESPSYGGSQTHLLAGVAGTIVACSNRSSHRPFARVQSHVTRNRRGSGFPLN